MKKAFFYIWLFSIPFLSISPWQKIIFTKIPVGVIFFLVFVFLVFLNYDGLRIAKVKEIFRKNGLVYFFLFSFVLWNILSLFFNWKNISSPAYMLEAVGLKGPYYYNFIFLSYFLLNVGIFVFVSRYFYEKKEIIKALKVLLIASGMASLYGILTIWGFMLGIVKELVFAAHYVPRLYGTALEPQSFGNYLLPIVFFGIFFAFYKKYEFFSAFSFFLVFLAFFMTFSIGAWVGAFVGLLFLIVVSIKLVSINQWLKLAGFLIMILFFGLCFNSFLYPSYYEALFKYSTKIQVWKVNKESNILTSKFANRSDILYKHSSSEVFDDKATRLWMAQTAVNMFRAHPIIGIGPGNYGFLYNSYRPKNTPIKDFIERAHNAYLQLLGETGLVGLLLFTAFLSLILFESAKRFLFLQDLEARLLGLAIFSGFIGLLVQGFSYGIFQHVHTWVVLGLLMAAKDNI